MDNNRLLRHFHNTHIDSPTNIVHNRCRGNPAHYQIANLQRVEIIIVLEDRMAKNNVKKI